MKKVIGLVIFIILVVISVNLIRYELDTGVVNDFKEKINSKKTNQTPRPDQYYIDMFKEEYEGTSLYDKIYNSLCVVNTISQEQVKVSCKYTVGVNCIKYNPRTYTGACDQYEYYEDRVIDKIYDIEYEEVK